MSVMSLFFSCATRLWCMRWKSRSFRKLSQVVLARAATSCASFSSALSAATSSSSTWAVRIKRGTRGCGNARWEVV